MRKKGVLMLVCLVLVIFCLAEIWANAAGPPDPAVTFCLNQGYTLLYTERGETFCVFEDNTACDIQDFYVYSRQNTSRHSLSSKGLCGPKTDNSYDFFQQNNESINILSDNNYCFKENVKNNPQRRKLVNTSVVYEATHGDFSVFEDAEILEIDCCEGLKNIVNLDRLDEDCNLINEVRFTHICSDCGNKICDDFESKCNCPEDCDKDYDKAKNEEKIIQNDSEKVKGKSEIKKENKTYLNLSNGRNAEIKIMPETASQRAIERLGELNFSVVLKEVGQGIEKKPAYEISAEKPVRLFGLFKKSMKVKAVVDAENGEVINVDKPWWSFLAFE